MKGLNDNLNAILNHTYLFQSSKFHQKKTLAFVSIWDEERSTHIPSSTKRQGSHSHKLAEADQDFTPRSRSSVQCIQKTQNFPIRLICLLLPFRYIPLNINLTSSAKLSSCRCFPHFLLSRTP